MEKQNFETTRRLRAIVQAAKKYPYKKRNDFSFFLQKNRCVLVIMPNLEIQQILNELHSPVCKGDQAIKATLKENRRIKVTESYKDKEFHFLTAGHGVKSYGLNDGSKDREILIFYEKIVSGKRTLYYSLQINSFHYEIQEKKEKKVYKAKDPTRDHLSSPTYTMVVKPDSEKTKYATKAKSASEMTSEEKYILCEKSLKIVM